MYIKGHFIYRFILCFMNRKNRSESEESRGQASSYCYDQNAFTRTTNRRHCGEAQMR